MEITTKLNSAILQQFLLEQEEAAQQEADALKKDGENSLLNGSISDAGIGTSPSFHPSSNNLEAPLVPFKG